MKKWGKGKTSSITYKKLRSHILEYSSTIWSPFILKKHLKPYKTQHFKLGAPKTQYLHDFTNDYNCNITSLFMLR